MEVDDTSVEKRKRSEDDSTPDDDYYPQIGIIYDDKLMEECNKVPQIKERVCMDGITIFQI